MPKTDTTTWVAGGGAVLAVGSYAYTYREVARLQTQIEEIKIKLARQIDLLRRHLSNMPEFQRGIQQQLKTIGASMDKLWENAEDEADKIDRLTDAVIELQEIMKSDDRDIQVDVLYRERTPSPRRRRKPSRRKSKKSKKSRLSRKVTIKDDTGSSSSSSEDDVFAETMRRARRN